MTDHGGGARIHSRARECNGVTTVLTEIPFTLAWCPLCPHTLSAHVHGHDDPWVVGGRAQNMSSNSRQVTGVGASLRRAEPQERNGISL
jgi:hypothetical protein